MSPTIKRKQKTRYTRCGIAINVTRCIPNNGLILLGIVARANMFLMNSAKQPKIQQPKIQQIPLGAIPLGNKKYIGISRRATYSQNFPFKVARAVQKNAHERMKNVPIKKKSSMQRVLKKMEKRRKKL